MNRTRSISAAREQVYSFIVFVLTGNEQMHCANVIDDPQLAITTYPAATPKEPGHSVPGRGSSSYNGLEASLSKRLSRGLQMLASYNYSKTLDTDGSNSNGISPGNTATAGNQNSPQQRWGRVSFDRTNAYP